MFAYWQDPTPRQAGDDFGNVEAVHPVGLTALCLLVLVAQVLPRRLASLPIVLLLCFIPAGQRFVIATIDFPFLRLLMAAIWLRLLARSEIRSLVWNHLDRLVLAWSAVVVVTGTLYAGTLNVFVNRGGTALDTMMVYFFFRQVIRTPADLAAIAQQFLACSFAVVAFMAVEHQTQRNLFYVFGGVPEFTEVRDGRLRCQGAFAHPILAGCFWAAMLPFYAALGFLQGRWGRAIAGSGVAMAIVVLCASSTPVVAVLMFAVAAAVWQIRHAMRWVRWLSAFALVFLHLFMNMPVWHLLARIDIAGGSTGWHRYHLVDKFIENHDEWLWLGTSHTGHWGPGLQDVTNQYVAEGVGGGIVRLLAFVAIIGVAFAGVSRTMRLAGLGRVRAYVTWALGSALFVHCMNYLAVSYFEQIVALWHLTLAAIGSLTLVPGALPAHQMEAESSRLATA